MKQGTSTGVLDEFLTDICVGDEIVDKAGTHYTIDRFGRAKHTSGGNEVPLKSLEGATVCKSWAGHAESITKAVETKPQAKGAEQAIHAMYEGVDAASDQMLVDKLRERGWTVTCTKIIEKVVYEEASL